MSRVARCGTASLVPYTLSRAVQTLRSADIGNQTDNDQSFIRSLSWANKGRSQSWSDLPSWAGMRRSKTLVMSTSVVWYGLNPGKTSNLHGLVWGGISCLCAIWAVRVWNKISLHSVGLVLGGHIPTSLRPTCMDWCWAVTFPCPQNLPPWVS